MPDILLLERVSTLWAKRLKNQITPDETAELQNWETTHPEAAAALNKWMEKDQIQDILKELTGVRESVNAQLIKAGVPVNAKYDSLSRVPRKALINRSFLRYAASIALLLGIFAYFYQTRLIRPANTIITQQQDTIRDILPGGDKAILILDDGSAITLEKAINGQLARHNGVDVIKRSDGQLEYMQKDKTAPTGEPVAFHTLRTPKGGQYQLTLPDGTRVWLNAESSIHYPVTFNGMDRTVSITGEVYFEVSKNKSKPFIVKTYQEDITVLGTRFNVNCYADESAVKTSLQEGSVRISNKVLKPGQAYFRGNVTTTDLEHDLAWKKGVFNFNHLPLDKVMKQLSRWYDIQVIYKESIPEVEFYGEVQRSLNLTDVLEVLSGLGVRFTINKERKLEVSKG